MSRGLSNRYVRTVVEFASKRIGSERGAGGVFPGWESLPAIAGSREPPLSLITPGSQANTGDYDGYC
jgi:hypothetical protein